MFTLRDAPAAQARAGERKHPVTLSETLRALFTQPAFWILVRLLHAAGDRGLGPKNWLPTFLADTFKLAKGPAGLSATGYIQIASFLGVLFGGILADRWMRTTPARRIFASAIGVFLCVPALLGLGFAWSLGAAIAFMLLFGLGWGFFDCNNMPILCQIARPEAPRHRLRHHEPRQHRRRRRRGPSCSVDGAMRASRSPLRSPSPPPSHCSAPS